MTQKVALVTGAAAGIGAEICRQFADEGMAVGVLDLKLDAAQSVVDEITAKGGKALALAADVSDRGQVEAAVARLREEFGPITVLVNNAGISAWVPFEEIDDAAWDLMMGSMAALSLIVAERNRSETGIGGEVRIPLSDVAFSTIANLGMLEEVISSGHDRPRYGNDLFGAFGRDFQTRDGARVMIVALTPRQWTSLIEALQLTSSVDRLEQELGVEFTRDEGTRFRHRDRINPMVADAVQRHSLDEITKLFNEKNFCWDVYRTVKEAYEQTPDLAKTNPIYRNLRHPSGEEYPAPGFAGTFSELERKDPVAAPQLGAHTTEVLRSVLNYTTDEIRDFQEVGTVATD